MKAVLRTVALLSCLSLAAGAWASVDHQWTGADSNWLDDLNWSSGPGDYPGQNGTGDSARIDSNSFPTSVTIGSAIPFPIDFVLVDADTAGADLTLTVSNNATFGYMDLRGAGSDVAKLVVNDPDLTLTDGSLSFRAMGEVEIDVANSTTFDAGSQIYVTGPANVVKLAAHTGIMSADEFVLDASAGAITFTVNGGSVQIP